MSYFESSRSAIDFNSGSNEIFVDDIQGMFGHEQMLTAFGTIIGCPWKWFLAVWATYNSHSKSPYRVAIFPPDKVYVKGRSFVNVPLTKQ
jgi:hypothetical protein